MYWGDVNARARGLAAHLVSRFALEYLAAAPDLAQLIQRTRSVGIDLDVESLAAGSATDLDQAVGRLASWRLAVLGRWLGRQRRPVLAVVYERIDLDTLRRLLRGVVQGASPVTRLRGLIPTPDLPERAIRKLAEADSLAELAGRLVRRGHPAGRVIAREGAGADGSALIRLELALTQLFAGRSKREARRGDRELHRFVAESIDLWNAATLLERDGWGDALVAEDLWIEGGRAVGRECYLAAAVLPDPKARRQRLAECFGAHPFATPLSDPSLSASDVDRGILRIWIDRFRRAGRERPLSSAPTLHVVLRILAEARDLRSVIWGVALRAPPETVLAALLAA